MYLPTSEIYYYYINLFYVIFCSISDIMYYICLGLTPCHGLVAEWSKAAVCKTAYRGFESHLNLISQNGAVVARVAHNHQVAGSSPASATNTDRTVIKKK